MFLWMRFLKDDALTFLKVATPLDLSHAVASTKLKCAILQWQVARAEGITNTNGDGESETAGVTDKSTSSELFSFDRRAVQDIGCQKMLLPAILDYDREQRLCVFNASVFVCHVCFAEKLGHQCLQFDVCGHVYCKECMHGYFKVQIQEGSVQSLTCPFDQCETQAHPAQVRWWRHLVSSSRCRPLVPSAVVFLNFARYALQPRDVNVAFHMM